MLLLRSIQNSCLRTVAGAYKTTPVRSLEVETYIPQMEIYLDSRVAAFQKWLKNSSAYSTVKRACSEIRARLKSSVARKSKTQGQLRREWAQRRAVDQSDRTEEKQILHEWTQRWETEQNGINCLPLKTLLNRFKMISTSRGTSLRLYLIGGLAALKSTTFLIRLRDLVLFPAKDLTILLLLTLLSLPP
jgi:hypothetical protein